MISLSVATKKQKEVVDITNLISEELSKNNFDEGICVLFLLHTTACLTTADLDPGTDLDLLDLLKSLVPDIPFRHPHNPAHAPDHIISSMIGPSITIPFKNKQLTLGTWQRVILIELDGPRERKINMILFPSESN